MPGKKTYKKSNRKFVNTFKRIGKTYPIQKYQVKSKLNVHHFKYLTLQKNWKQVEMNGSDVFFGFGFQFTDVASQVDLTNMFDMYRINAVMVEIIPRQPLMIYGNAAGSGDPAVPNVDAGGTHLQGTSNYGHPEILTAIDYNDSTAPTLYKDLLEYGTCKIVRGDRVTKRMIKAPRINIDTTVLLSLSKRWISTSKADVPHFGLKGCISNVPNISIDGTSDRPLINYDLKLTYYISFRNTK